MTHFARQFTKKLANDSQDLPPLRRERIFATRARTSLGIATALEPAAGFHPPQHRIERAGAHAVAVLAEFLEHPLPHDRPFGRMVKDVDLPEAQENLAPGGRQGPLAE